MLARTARAVTITFVAALPMSSCGEPSPPAFDPRGSDTSFHFSWRVNGLDVHDPSDPCTVADIRFIRMNVLDASERMYPIDAFRFDCHLGSYTSAHPELRAGTYRIFWEALAHDGTRRSIAAGVLDDGGISPSLELVTVPSSGTVDFDASNRPDETFPPAPTNFATAQGPLRVTFVWGGQHGAMTGPDCMSASVDRIDYALRRSNHAVIDARSDARCADGFNAVQWDALDFDEYGLDVSGFDATGALRYRGHCEPLPVRLGGALPNNVTCVVDAAP
jgi:hypothetical protein